MRSEGFADFGFRNDGGFCLGFGGGELRTDDARRTVSGYSLAGLKIEPFGSKVSHESSDVSHIDGRAFRVHTSHQSHYKGVTLLLDGLAWILI